MMMKMLNVLILSFVVVALASTNAEAARRKKKVVAPKPTEIALPIPQSELPLATYLPPVKEPLPVTLEVGISSWTPSNFTRSTRTVGNQNFESGSIPMLSINRMGIIDSRRLKGLYSKIGLSAASLERNVEIQRPGGSVTVDQDMNLYSARLGVEYRARRYFEDVVQPIVSFAALPTMGLASRSGLEEEVTSLGVPFELAAGATFSPSFMPNSALGVHGTSLGLGVQYLFGKIGASNADGLGIQGSLRVEL